MASSSKDTASYPQIQLQSPSPLPLRPEARVNSANPFSTDYEFLARTSDAKVIFHHPGYPPQQDLLFILSAWDSQPSDPGIHFGLAHNACAIIADNKYDGYLSTSRVDTPAARVYLEVDEILPAGDYWFFVPAPSADSETCYCWPVVPTFTDWLIPNDLPAAWTRLATTKQAAPFSGSQSALSQATRLRDRTCRISDHSTGTEIAHLCPKHEKDWFLGNSMEKWTLDTSLDADRCCDDTCNTLLLRSDLHKAFDDRQFVFFPKTQDGFVVHMLQATPDLGQLYHNTRTHDIYNSSLRFVYARFAWALFPLLGRFLQKTNRRVIVVQPNRVQIIEDRTHISLSSRATKSRSSSPRKRLYQAVGGSLNDDEESIHPPEHTHKRQRLFELQNDQHHRELPHSSSELAPPLQKLFGKHKSEVQPMPHENVPVNNSRLSIHQPQIQNQTQYTATSVSSPEYIPNGFNISACGNSSQSSLGPQLSTPSHQQEEMELQELFSEAEKTGIDESLLPPSMYPGWREMDRIREEALAKQRPYGY